MVQRHILNSTFHKLENMRASLISGLLLAIFLAGLSLFTFFGTPGILHGPWEPNALLALKRKEELAYLLCVFLTPCLAVFFSYLLCRRQIQRPVIFTECANPPIPIHARLSNSIWMFVVPAIIFVIVPLGQLNAPIDPVDDGLRLAETAQFENGGRLYRDVFLNYGPLSEIFQTKLAFELFGRNAAALRKIDHCIEAFAYVSAFWLALILIERRWLLALFFTMILGKAFFAITPRLCFPLWALSLLVLSWRHGRHRTTLQCLSGICLSLAFFYSSEGGVLLTSSLLTFYLLQIAIKKVRREFMASLFKEITFIFIGAATVSGLFVVWLVATGRLSDFFQNLQAVYSASLALNGKPTPLLFKPLSASLRNPFVFFTSEGSIARLWFPPLFFIAVLSSLFQDALLGIWNDRNKDLLLMTVTAIFFFFLTMGRWDFAHWLQATQLFWILALMVVDRCIAKTRLSWSHNRRDSILPAATGVYLVAFLCLHISPFRITDRLIRGWQQWNFGLVDHSRIGFVDYSSAHRTKLIKMVDKIQQYVSTSDSLFIFGDEASYYFLADRKNATPFSLECYIVTSKTVEQTIDALAKNKPALILARGQGSDIQFRPVQKPLAEFVLKNYKKIDEQDDFLLLVPR